MRSKKGQTYDFKYYFPSGSKGVVAMFAVQVENRNHTESKEY